MKTQLNPRFAIILLLILAAVATRIISIFGYSLFSFSPVGAVALFGGAYFTNRWKALLVPLIILFLSDLFIQNIFYKGEFGWMYSGWYWVYGAFACIVLLGTRMLRKVTIKNFLFSCIAASAVHLIITDFGMWLGGINVITGKPFTKDWQGFITCYSLALPFLKNFFMGTLIYGALIFGIFEVAQLKYPVLSRKNA